jgi:hypothetical protein
VARFRTRLQRTRAYPAWPWRTRARLAAIVPLALLVTACGRLDRDAVRTEVGKIESSGAEGMLLSREAARGRVWPGFVVIHSAELQSQAEKAQEKLNATPAEDGWNNEASEAVTLAGRIADQLGHLHAHPNDRQRADRISQNLADLSKKLDDLSSKL